MKALSLLQPWATLVVLGVKKIETRSWRTPYRGELLIHASLGKTGAVLAGEPPFTKYILNFSSLPFGALVGKVILEDVLPVTGLFMSDAAINQLSLEEKAFGDYTTGRYAWMLTDAIQFRQPVRVNGTLGLWEYSGSLPDVL